MMTIPTDLKYMQSHEWVRENDDGTLTVGITEFAQEQLGDVVFVETPEVDLECEAEQAVAVVESVKAASDIYAPVAGKIMETNGALADEPELVNSSPYENGWLYQLEPRDGTDIENLMDAEGYEAHISAGT